ncbi:MAG: PHP domain-containing protein [Bacillota bacterium]|jgi:predicted metal-dependent phosphoesterase TrpH|nr:PHP domain-containing protein [Bacillota bacterium]NLL25920.1 PHP domain-containing protein [Erysipelotrichia bacterium]
MKIDLHIHTNKSADGELTAKEIVLRAKKLDMDIIAISDHDSVSALSDAVKWAKEYEIDFVPATEVSAVMDDGTLLHILGLNIDYQDQRFIDRENEVKNKYRGFAEIMMQKAWDFGFKFDAKKVIEVSNDGLVDPESIGEIVLQDKRNDDDERLKEFRAGGKLADNPYFNFYREFYAQGKPCYSNLDFSLPLKEAAKLIHDCGGIMILAHPFHNIGFNEVKLKEIISYGLDGLEVYSTYHDQKAIDYYYKKAKKYNLLMSVGSDFHGRNKPAIEIGCLNFDRNEVDKLIAKIKKCKRF